MSIQAPWWTPVFITDDGNETHSFVLTINFTAIQVLVLVIKPRFVHFFPLFSWGKCEYEKHRCPEGRLTWHQRVTTWWYAGRWGRNGGSKSCNQFWFLCLMHIRTPNETIVRIKRKKEKKTRWENSHCIREHEAGWRVVTPVSDTSSRRLFWGVAPLSDWSVSHLAILDSILPNGSSITQTPHTQTSGGKKIYIYEEVGGGWSRKKLGRKKSCGCCSCKLADVTSFARLTPQGRGRQNREGWQSVRGGWV